MRHHLQQQRSAGRAAGRRAVLAVTLLACLGRAQSVVEGQATGARDVAEALDAAVVVEWNALAYELAWAEDEFQTFKGQRAMVLMNLAMHDALNTIRPGYERYAYAGARVRADPELAAAQAAHAVLASQYPAAIDRLDSLLSPRLEAASGAGKGEASVALGREAADAILRVREADGWDEAGTYAFTTRAGRYRTTPDWDGFVLQPGFRSARPFAIGAVTAFRPAPPPGLSDTRYARDYDEVRVHGAADSPVRTADQTAYAVWWMEFSEGSVTRLARRLAMERDLELWDAARLFAHLSMALFDVYVATWDSKYEYDHWRPYTAIRNAADDGNPATTPDEAWTSMLPAPPFPEYVSAHAAGCSAAFTVLASEWGSIDGFAMTTITAPPEMPSRRFESFRAAAEECADSRVRLGWHFRYSTDAGLRLGVDVANHVLGTQLRPAGR